ncbi:unnamed protein product [Lathyrus oleraceus]
MTRQEREELAEKCRKEIKGQEAPLRKRQRSPLKKDCSSSSSADHKRSHLTPPPPPWTNPTTTHILPSTRIRRTFSIPPSPPIFAGKTSPFLPLCFPSATNHKNPYPPPDL